MEEEYVKQLSISIENLEEYVSKNFGDSMRNLFHGGGAAATPAEEQMWIDSLK